MSLLTIILIISAISFIGVMLMNYYTRRLYKTANRIAGNIISLINGNTILPEEVQCFQLCALTDAIKPCLPRYKWLKDTEILEIFVTDSDIDVNPSVDKNFYLRKLKYMIEFLKKAELALPEEPANKNLYCLELSKYQVYALYVALNRVSKPPKALKKVMSKLKAILHSK